MGELKNRALVFNRYPAHCAHYSQSLDIVSMILRLATRQRWHAFSIPLTLHGYTRSYR